MRPQHVHTTVVKHKSQSTCISAQTAEMHKNYGRYATGAKN